MAKQQLPTNFKDDILAPQMAGKRRYRIIQNDDGTVSLEDVTDYSRVGSDFGAAQINAMNMAVNESFDKNKVIDSLDDIAANESAGYAAGALAVRELNGKLEDAIIVKTYTKDNIFVSANSYASVAVNAPVISGYNRVMWQTSIYNATTGGTHVTNCWITSATVTTGNDNMNVMITNSGGTQAKLKVIVKMLYVKTKA